jgi:site-specific DNA-cytosine methylase
MIIDLFSGSGSASKIWSDNGYRTYRFDIVVPGEIETLPCDLSNLEDIKRMIYPLKQVYGRPLLIWASPPCTEYSDRHPRRNDPEFIPDVTLWRNAEKIINYFNPVFYVIENVRGAMREHGQPTQKCGPYYLWGRFPKFNIPGKQPHKNFNSYNNKPKWLRAKETAQIPYKVSYGLYSAITKQTSIDHYCL